MVPQKESRTPSFGDSIMPEYLHPSLLNEVQEAKLREEFAPLWEQGLSGMKIAQQLQFSIPNTPYAQLHPCYVYYYRFKFTLPTRHRPYFSKTETVLDETGKKREFRYKVRPKPLNKELNALTPKKFVELLNEKLPNNINVNLPKRSLIICLYWSGLRSSELYEREVTSDERDFTITDEAITIHLLRKKKRTHIEDDEPINIPRVFPLVEELVEYLQSKCWETRLNGEPNLVEKYNIFGNKIKVKGRVQRELNHRPWQISRTTAENWVKQFYNDAYPHFFRYNMINSATKLPDFRVSQIKGKTFLTLPALERYVITEESEGDLLDKKRIAEMKKTGLIKEVKK
jgi:hypothetical protein